MPPVVQIIPRASSGRNAFEWKARFDMSRTKSIISEDMEKHFRQVDIITYPGPVGLIDADWQPLHSSGEVTFNITIVERTTSVTTWMTNAIKRGQLIIGSGMMEDLGLRLLHVPDYSNPRGHAQETSTVRIPGGGSALTRSARDNDPTHNHNGTNMVPPEKKKTTL